LYNKKKLFLLQIKNVPIATHVILYPFSSNHNLKESIFRRIHLGTIISPNDWICCHGCYEIQYFKIIQIYSSDILQNTSSSNISTKEFNVARIFENTIIEFGNYQSEEFKSSGNLLFQEKSQWIDKVLKKIGGLDEVISEIIEQIHLFAITAMSNKCKKNVKRSKGIILTGKPGTGKTALALSLAGILIFLQVYSNL
jgi:hypothetical protein